MTSKAEPPSRRVVLADLHVHVGRAGGRPVKITASRRLTVREILHESACRKGLGIVGIVDAGSPPVLGELRDLVETGELVELSGGGLRGQPGPTVDRPILVVLASEVEVFEPEVGLVHYLAYVPDLEAARALSGLLTDRVTNITLSSQRARIRGEELARWVGAAGGMMVPAHVFTPYKGFFGQGGTDLAEVLSDGALDVVPAVELGLSADTALASRVPSLDGFTFLSNSDAHSPETIAREHNELIVELGAGGPDFRALLSAVRDGRVKANYGLDPRLGKYHRRFCPACGWTSDPDGGPQAPGQACPDCGRTRMVGGVYDRVLELAHEHPGRERPPYVHQIPLRYLPGVGRAGVEKLLAAFGSEFAVLHQVSREDLARVVGSEVVRRIIAARAGTAELEIRPGAGGRYGQLGHIKSGHDE